MLFKFPAFKSPELNADAINEGEALSCFPWGDGVFPGVACCMSGDETSRSSSDLTWAFCRLELGPWSPASSRYPQTSFIRTQLLHSGFASSHLTLLFLQVEQPFLDFRWNFLLKPVFFLSSDMNDQMLNWSRETKLNLNISRNRCNSERDEVVVALNWLSDKRK